MGLNDGPDNLTEEQIRFLRQQEEYGKMILAIGRGTWKGDHCISEDKQTGRQEILIPNVRCITDEQEANNFVYPNKFNNENFTERVILAGTNKEVDSWNQVIQRMNSRFLTTLKRLVSANILCEVDDPKGILKSMLTTEVLNTFNNNSVPPHEICLAVGDICLILRKLSKKDALAINTRVRILKISIFCIMVQYLGENSKIIAIPRFRFKFRLAFGQSYQLRRTQYRLRLAYCMSVNKSQGQEEESVLLDLRNQLLSHGHLYVALSRVRDASKVAIFTKPESTMLWPNQEIIATTTNIVHPVLLEPVGISPPIEEGDTWESYERFQASVSEVSIYDRDAHITFEKAWNNIHADI